MSSLYGSQSTWPENIPPQSAQPHQSLFGGPSSDVLQPSSQLEPPRSSLFGGPIGQDAPLEPFSEADLMDEELDHNENEFDMIMQEQHLAFQNDSDAESQGNTRGRSRIRSEKAQEAPLDPIYYVVDRGLDLPPGVERPNIFDGHATSWRNYNADDIGAYNAIITNRTRNLAAHLYNAHVIRKRAQDTARENPGVVDKVPFRVNKRWAAWPVHAATVPRANEIIQREMDASDNFQMQPDPRPSAGLEECITAFIMKTSKETFQAREWDLEESQHNSRNKMNNGKELTEDELGKKEETQGARVVARTLRPTVLLDDDKATRQLHPLVRNVISQVDRLLYGLHCAMKGRKFEEDSGEEQWSDSDGEGHQTRGSRNLRSRSRSRGRRSARQESQKRNLSRPSESAHISTRPETKDDNMPDVSQTRAQSCGFSTGRESSHRINGRFKLRDWSEVMGLASMMGLPSSAVMRASKRCADLFGEDMEFRIMPEGRVRKRRKVDAREEYVYTESASDSDSEPLSRQPTRKSKTEPGLGPKAKAKIPGQRRSKSHMTPAIVPSSATSSPAPEEPTEPRDAITENSRRAIAQGPRRVRLGVGKGPHRKVDIICPYRSCNRHTNGFSRKWNLNQHLKKAHGVHAASGNERPIERDATVVVLD